MKKILVLALVIAMVASMGVTATATQGTGTITFQQFDPDQAVATRGIHNPMPPTESPAGPAVWPVWTNDAPTIAAMHSWDIAFGTRAMPAPGAITWGSHADATGVTAILPTGNQSDLLGLLIQNGWVGGAPPAGQALLPEGAAEHRRVTAALGQFRIGGGATPTLNSFNLTLGVPTTANLGNVGFVQARPPIAAGPGGAVGWSRPATATLIQQDVSPPVLGHVPIISVQHGVYGAQWWGDLGGTVAAGGANVVQGEAQAQIVFVFEAIP